VSPYSRTSEGGLPGDSSQKMANLGPRRSDCEAIYTFLQRMTHCNLISTISIDLIPRNHCIVEPKSTGAGETRA